MITIVLNAGFHRDGKVDRCEGDEHKIKTFGVYCPKALAGIGDYTTDTVTDRFSGTRLATSLRTLLHHRTWNTTVRGAVVLICSDG